MLVIHQPNNSRLTTISGKNVQLELEPSYIQDVLYNDIRIQFRAHQIRNFTSDPSNRNVYLRQQVRSRRHTSIGWIEMQWSDQQIYQMTSYESRWSRNWFREIQHLWGEWNTKIRSVIAVKQAQTWQLLEFADVIIYKEFLDLKLNPNLENVDSKALSKYSPNTFHHVHFIWLMLPIIWLHELRADHWWHEIRPLVREETTQNQNLSHSDQ